MFGFGGGMWVIGGGLAEAGLGVTGSEWQQRTLSRIRFSFNSRLETPNATSDQEVIDVALSLDRLHF